ncbi:MAG: retroviral-like aspartic protease family protein [Gemmataceae bacterium]|nr:retroviral-like aspartic protease family protein [Gemmataceae bacterium]
MGRFKVELELANNNDVVLADSGHLAADKVRRARIQGVVDSGATRLVLPKSVADQLGLPDAGKVLVRYADKRRAARKKVKGVWLKLLGRDSVFNAIVEPKRTDALIGAIVMEDLDLIIDCTMQTLLPRNPKGIVSEIE